MFKKICFLFFLLNAILVAQQRDIDSLENQLLSTKLADSTRLNLLTDLGYYYYSINAKKGLKVLDEALLLAKSLKDIDKEARAYQYKGHNYSTIGNDSMALAMYDKAGKIYKTTNNYNKQARLIYNKGLIYFNKSNYAKANKCNIEAFEAFKQANDSVLMAKMLNSMGVNYMYLSDYPSSLSKYLEALTIYKDLKDTISLDFANTTQNLGILYTKLKTYKKALVYHEKASEIYKTLDYKYGLANSYNNIGNIYDYLNQQQKAIDNYQKSYGIMQKSDNKLGMANALTNIGIVNVGLKKYNKALNNFNKAKALYETLGNTNNLAIVHEYIGESYLNTSSLHKAKNHYQKAYSLAKKSKSISLQVSALEGLTEVNKQLKDYKNAYNYINEAIILKDSFNSIENKEELVRLEEKYKYQNEKSILENNYKQEQLLFANELERQKFIKTTYLAGSGIVLCFVVGLMVFYKKKREADFNAKVATTELKALRAQMNPHFIFNTLNSINNYIVCNKINDASNYLIKFSKLMRQTLEVSMYENITVEEDIKLLENYLDIEKKRIPNGFNYEIKIDDGIDKSNVLVPSMIMQPFVENSIWHGVSKLDGSGVITIQIKKLNKQELCYSVDDNGVGITNTNKKNTDHTSLGVKITNDRIAVLNKTKNINAKVNIINKSLGTRVEVILPYQLAYLNDD
ncbi:tetratricopeptide repeat-containing sensor histidine kinase [Tamlana crocina]|uniref:Tetratricopeptide repeat protein n=1 Tax=Tamlana crocina TaxID=393006 RepID=A0ABX1DC07_9FLAO|nr:tetratricopeptide repeat protein [Tamlana crocina]NJX15800.1 tetratricopeptide repeat protein [Tamlana crocina]